MDNQKLNVVLYRDIPSDLLDRLKSHFNVTQFDSINKENEIEFKEALSLAQGAIGSYVTFDKQLLDISKSIRAISTISVGYDNFDVKEMTNRNIALMNTPTVLTETCADTTFLLILSAARRSVELANRVKNGEWKSHIGPSWFGTDVHSKTLGILGMGRIGLAVAKRALGFSMKVLYTNRTDNENAKSMDIKRVDYDTLLKQSDFLVISVPLSKETYHIVGRDQFAKMKNTAIIVNIGRGALIDEQAMIEALKNKVIGGAGLDVFEKEPLSIDSPLLSLDNVVALPHIGSATHETRYAMCECATDNLIRVLLSPNTVKSNCVNPEVLITSKMY